MNTLDDELIKLSNDIYLKYIDDGELEGLIKTSYNETPTHHDFLLVKRDLKNRLSNLDKNYYIDDVELTFGKHSRDDVFNSKHKWDAVGIIYSFGLILPFLLPVIIPDLYTYYNSKDFNFISYKITKRQSNVISNVTSNVT